jgi:hypothetical protein
MTAKIEDALRAHLLRADGQEDLCFATYRPSTGVTRTAALLRRLVLPEPGERDVHGNASFTGDYVIRAAADAQQHGEGLVLLHSHPGGARWQGMSSPDRDAESSIANLVREMTGLPLVGMTLAGADGTWSARMWNEGVGADVAETHADNVRVIDDTLRVSWHDALVPPPAVTRAQRRSVSCWGERVQDELVRRSVLVVGLGSVGLDVALRLAATGMTRIGIMDFDVVEAHNLDRLIGATAVDAFVRRSKLDVARRLITSAATAEHLELTSHHVSVVTAKGLAAALDYDMVICCVDRPWARAVLNGIAYTDLIPVIDGGIAIDVFAAGDGMRNATWRSHIARPGRPCLVCNGQLSLGEVAADIDGSLDDPIYIAGRGGPVGGQNVAALSVSVTAAILAQFVSFNIGPGAIGDPGPLQYVLSTNTLERLAVASQPHCPVEGGVADGDHRVDLTGDRDRAAAGPRRFGLMRSVFRMLDASMASLQRQLQAAARRRL